MEERNAWAKQQIMKILECNVGICISNFGTNKSLMTVDVIYCLRYETDVFLSF